MAPALVLFVFACGGAEGKPLPANDSARAHRVMSTLAVSKLPAPGRRRYVATNGSDRGPGTIRRPWRTVEHGLDAIKKGQALLIRNGSYPANIVLTHGGTPKRPIVVQNYPGEHPVLLPGEGNANNGPLQVGTGAAYVRFSGLIFQGANGPSTANVYLWGTAHDITFSRCEVRNSARQGFFSEATTRAIHIIGCYFHDNGGLGPANQDHNIYMEGRDHVIANTIVTGAKNGYGIQLYPSSNHVVIANNTIVGNQSGIIVGGQGGAATTRALLVNNIVAFNDQYGITTYWGDGSKGSGNYAVNNLGYGNGSTSFDSSEGGGISFQKNLTSDPRFVNRAAGNFRLRPTSGAIDRALGSYAPRFDFDGRRRPQGRRPDEGAFERPR